jgi:hypothetical protein
MSSVPRSLAPRILPVLVVGALLALVPGARSIVVAPTAVYMDHTARSAEVTLHNPSDAPEEVTVAALFGYPATDEAGTLHLHVDPEGTDPRSAAGWLRAFPERVVVPPGGRQVIRIFGDPPSALPDGEYWARLVITARGQSVPVQSAGGGGIQVGLDLEVQTLIAATYRKGPVTTGLELRGLSVDPDEGFLRVRPDLVRTGNGAWIGSMRVRILDSAGRERFQASEQVAVYRELSRLLRYPVAELPPGPYRVEVTFAADRTDIPARFRLPSPELARSVDVVLP